MVYEQKPVVLKEPKTFETVLEEACDRLKEKHIQYSIRRIRELDEILDKLEKELESFMGSAHARF